MRAGLGLGCRTYSVQGKEGAGRVFFCVASLSFGFGLGIIIIGMWFTFLGGFSLLSYQRYYQRTDRDGMDGYTWVWLRLGKRTGTLNFQDRERVVGLGFLERLLYLGWMDGWVLRLLLLWDLVLAGTN